MGECEDGKRWVWLELSEGGGQWEELVIEGAGNPEQGALDATRWPIIDESGDGKVQLVV